jgi:hypothetical protein
MKKLMKITLLLLLTGSMASCNLDKYPAGDAIPEEQAFTTFKDATQFRLSIYYFPPVLLVLHGHPGEYPGRRRERYAGLR